MCGIVGTISERDLPIDAATETLAHRGPDAGRTWAARQAGWHIQLGHRRLAILDLSEAGAQPMRDAAGDLTLVFNGEIYNFRELRRELEGRGSTFRSTTDTEVILEGYRAWGDRVVERIEGIFAFGLWDAREGRLLLARDRIGVKPLFVARSPRGLAFASEIKALFPLGVPKRLRPGTLARFLTYLYVPGPETAFDGIEELPPAHRLTWNAESGTRVEAYWQFPSPDRSTPGVSDPELAAQTRDVLDGAVKRQLVSDVPLGAFLSGGLDSSSIVALMARHQRRPKTFCMVFGAEGRHYDERDYAREVARRFGTEHTEIEVEPKVTGLLEAMVDHFDQPFGNPTALLTYELSRLTRKHVTVALSGDGGDEMFLGYPRYAGAALAARYRCLPASFRRLLRQAGSGLRERADGRHAIRRLREFLTTGEETLEVMYQRWVTYFSPEDLAETLADQSSLSQTDGFLEKLFAVRSTGTFVERAAEVDAQSFLPHNVLAYGDRMSMAHGLELRVPFCDEAVVAHAARIPAARRMRGLRLKSLLKDAMAGELPVRTVNRRKMGFNPPLGVWLKNELRPLAKELLKPARLERSGIRPSGVTTMLREHDAGLRDRSLYLWALMVFQVWHAKHFGSDT